ncbi:YqcI/YcgG family protein [Paenibacillus sp. YYML68]|uniref:YqcI/YcgG family protein n=1 Tax=Paenibacillus sp. YYML68 TaxID=2909250 RepID=UPI0024931D31|nr:YqcI/YcgG family protein [Paenibacillus sp. YYML68]
MSILYSRSELMKQLEELESWQAEAFTRFANTIADPEDTYPCIPGRHGFLSDHLRFGFVGHPTSEETSKQVAQLLQQYGRCSRSTGKYASLVIFCNTSADPEGAYTVEEYESMFWRLLSEVTQHDPQEWPGAISDNPTDASWEFCHDGEPYFTFCATPAHEQRRSRQFPSFMLAFQPRWVFAEINDATTFGRRMKALIRKRLLGYDRIDVHPALKWYGQEGNLEWKQYFLRDDNSSPSKCPFTRMKKALNPFGARK